MADYGVVDSIVAELIAKDNGYIATFDRAISKHKEFSRSIPKVDGLQPLAAGAQRYADQHNQSLGSVVRAEQQAAQGIASARKKRSDAVKKAVADDVTAEKAGAAEIAAVRAQQARDEERLAQATLTARRRARLQAIQEARQAPIVAPTAPERGVTVASGLFSAGGGAIPKGSGTVLGSRSEEGDRSAAARQTEQARQVRVEAEQVAVAETEINHLRLNTYDITQKLRVAEGETARTLEKELDYLRRIDTYRRAGLSEEQAITRAVTEQAAVEKITAERSGRQVAAHGSGRRRGLGGLNEFALQASGGRLGYSFGPGALAGAAVLGGGAIVGAAASYGRQISDTSQQLGLSTRDLQVYEAMATKVGVTNEQVATSFGQLGDKISRARGGDKSAAKLFGKNGLNVDLSQFKSVGDALPTIVDRLSKIEDPAKRAAIGTELFGSAYRKLDSILAGGNANIEDFGKAMGDAVLTDTQIQALKDASSAIDDVKRELLVDFSKTVANNKDAIIGLADGIGKLTGNILNLANAHPQETLAAAGAYLGSRFGPVGVVGGAIGGMLLGKKLQQEEADSNSDPAFRLKKEQDAAALVRRLQANSLVRGSTSNDNYNAAVADLHKQVELYRQARASATPPQPNAPVQPGAPGNGNVFDGNGRRGPSAETLKKQADAREKRFEDEQAQYSDSFLQSLEQLATSTDERYRLAAESLKVEHDRRDTDISLQVKDHQIDAAREKELKAANDIAYAGKLAVLAADKRAEQLATINALQDQQIEYERQHLQNQGAFSRTPQDRLRNQLSQIDLAQKADRDQAIRTLFDPNANDRDKALAGSALQTNQSRFDEQRGVARHENMAPWADYVDKLPKTAEEIRNQFQDAAVNGVEALNSSLGKTIASTLHLHGLLGQILGDFIQIAIKSEEAKLFGGAGGGGGGLFGSLLGGIGSLFGGGFGASVASTNAGVGGLLAASNTAGFASIAGSFANGGYAESGKTYLVGERGPELLRMGSQGGTVIPNHAIVAPDNRAVRPNMGGLDGRIHVTVETNDDVFTAKVSHISGSQIQAAAPSIMAGSVSEGQKQQAKRARRSFV